MWDIHWTDPNRQLVGEHRAQKYAQRSRQDSYSASTSASGSTPTSPSAPNRKNKRNSLSTRSSLSSADSPFSFLRSFGYKSSRDTKSGVTSSAASGTFSTRKSVGSDYASARSSGVGSGDDGAKSQREGRIAERQEDVFPELSYEDSVFSRDVESDLGTSHSPGEASPRAKVHPSAQRHTSVISTMSGALMEPRDTVPERTRSQPNIPTASIPASPAETTKIKSQPLQSPATMQPSPFLKTNNVSAWKTPEEWAYSTIPGSPRTETPSARPGPNQQENIMSIDDLRSDIAKMDIMTPSAILQRLKNLDDESDSSETDAEKQRWMLWALTMDEKDLHKYNPPAQRNESLLALYESQIRTSYLAALNPSTQIHHLSPTPLPQSYSPLITPVQSTTLSPFPLSQLFNTATTLLLPSILPTSSTPEFLSSLSANLKAKGKLQITLINPIPRPSTTGPLMSIWLETHLLSSLRQNGICTMPTRLFPKWLGETGLRGQGSSLTTTKFFAVPPLDATSSSGALDDERLAKAHIRSLAGRTLWWTVWGRWVRSGKNRAKGWWDDPHVMEECAELGTIWEYHIIEAVKDG